MASAVLLSNKELQSGPSLVIYFPLDWLPVGVRRYVLLKTSLALALSCHTEKFEELYVNTDIHALIYRTSYLYRRKTPLPIAIETVKFSFLKLAVSDRMKIPCIPTHFGSLLSLNNYPCLRFYHYDNNADVSWAAKCMNSRSAE